MSYYAVYQGRQTGIFTTWGECQQQIQGYSGAKFKKFKTRKEAEHFSQYGKIPGNQDVSSLNKMDKITDVDTEAKTNLILKSGIIYIYIYYKNNYLIIIF